MGNRPLSVVVWQSKLVPSECYGIGDERRIGHVVEEKMSQRCPKDVLNCVKHCLNKSLTSRTFSIVLLPAKRDTQLVGRL